MLLVSSCPASARDASPFTQWGYYITFMRMPTYDLSDWKRIVDGINEDGGNTLLLWVAGAFRSKKFPITWAYNQEHENVRHDFVRDLIDHAQARGIKVLLGFTPFGYDGVNQYPLEHPETRAVGKDGKPIGLAGIGCWGYNLCPSKPESQQFMLGYVREMLSFYPNADGLMIESSDYTIYHCPDCGPRYFDKEFAFVKQISTEVWSKKPDAMIIVYPHYFSGTEVPGFGVKAAKQPFDPRWTLFFTPHSAHLDTDLIRQTRSSLWWDDSPALRRPLDIQQGARRARDAGVTGYVPSLEASASQPPSPRRVRPGSTGGVRCRSASAGLPLETRLTTNSPCESTASRTGSSATTPIYRSSGSRKFSGERSSARHRLRNWSKTY
jgi:hypothetical protein